MFLAFAIKTGKNNRMKTEKKLREAVEHVLDIKMFKSVNQLANVADIEQASLFRFRRGGMIKIDVASKLIDTLGGELVFPWDESDVAKLSAEVTRLENELEEKKNELIGLRANVKLLQDMIVQNVQVQTPEPQIKSCG